MTTNYVLAGIAVLAALLLIAWLTDRD